MAEMYGKQEGCSRGRGGSMHLFDAATRFYGGNAIVAAACPLAVGLALADKMQGAQRVTVCFFGDGAVAEGEFHESLNLAALWQLPVLFCCENNLYAMGTALARAAGRDRPRAAGGALRMPARPSTGWTSSPSRRPHAVPPKRSGPAADPVSWSADLPLPRALDVRPRALPGEGRGRALEGARPDRDVRPPSAGQGLLDDEDLAAIETEIVAEEIDAGVAFAEAATFEPVED